MKMLFLVLFSLVLVSSVEGQHFKQLKLNRGSDNLNESGELLGDCDDLVFDGVWTSLGIPERADGDQKYEINPETENAIVALLGTNNVLTLREQVISAKEKRPDLARDIENYIAVVTRPILVYIQSAFEEFEQNRNCIINDECPVMLPKNEALLYLDFVAEQLLNFVETLGEQTNQSFTEKLKQFDKILNLKCKWECVGKKYEQWMKKCAKPNQPIITEATDAYPVVHDSYVFSN